MVKKKNAITLLALVITIVIMLLLAGVAIQMTMGENGLIAKSVQAQKEQAKAELYDTAKLSYMSLNAKALENGQPSPQAELALSTTEFTNKYNVVGNDITDKNGNVIDIKANVLNVIQGTVAGGFSSGTSTGTTTPAVYKTVGGVQILEDDKDKLILKFNAREEESFIRFGVSWNVRLMNILPVEVDYGNGEKGTITDMYFADTKTYNKGEYILKFKNVRDFGINPTYGGDIEVLNWGKIIENNEKNDIYIYNVSKIYEPEPDRIPIHYIEPKFTEIPEWLFSKKVTSKVMSKFSIDRSDLLSGSEITTIPEDLFKNCVNAEDFNGIFKQSKIRNIPEGLFKYNVNATDFIGTFEDCRDLTNIPEGLFKYNVNATDFSGVFKECRSLTSIPEGLFKHNVNATDFRSIFLECRSLTSIPEGLFKNNVNVEDLSYTFRNCTGLTGIPEDIIEFGKKVKEKGGYVSSIFEGCISASNYNSLPYYMK